MNKSSTVVLSFAPPVTARTQAGFMQDPVSPRPDAELGTASLLPSSTEDGTKAVMSWRWNSGCNRHVE
ncbi:MAG: hypothetical protein ABI287_00145 [Rhodanobacter sp.]